MGRFWLDYSISAFGNRNPVKVRVSCRNNRLFGERFYQQQIPKQTHLTKNLIFNLKISSNTFLTAFTYPKCKTSWFDNLFHIYIPESKFFDRKSKRNIL